MKKRFFRLFVAALALFCLSAAAEETVVFENGGLRLSVPAKYADLVIVETPENDPEGTLFSVTEKASREAAAEDKELREIAGFLFSVRAIRGEQLQSMLVTDMSGLAVFAQNPGDADLYFLLKTPTDYRFYRESYEDVDDDEKQFAKLCAWANSVPETFTAENGLSPKHHDNTELDMHFARILFDRDMGYTLTTLEEGTAAPTEEFEAENLAACFVEEVTYEQADLSEIPDGEYIVMNFEDGCRFDFFLAEEGQNLIRHIWSDGEYVELFRVRFGEESETATQIMTQWYEALLAAGK